MTFLGGSLSRIFALCRFESRNHRIAADQAASSSVVDFAGADADRWRLESKATGFKSFDGPEIIRRHFAALAIGHEFKAYSLTFAQLAKTGALDGADMDEGVAAAVIGGDKSKSLLGVEPFHGSNCHWEPFRR